MYRLGIDMGIKSVGACVLECNEQGEPQKILKLATRIFDAAEVPKTGAPLAEPRRLARGTRRRLRRRTARLTGINMLFEENGIFIFDQKKDQKDDQNDQKDDQNDQKEIKDSLRNMNVLSKRVEALDGRITEEEFARVLYSIARYRGFKSNKKKGAQSDEDGKLIKAIKKNDEEMLSMGYRTVGEYLWKEYAEKGRSVHNKQSDYTMCIARDSLEKEVRLLFEKQKEYGNAFATDANLEKYIEYFIKQRTFDEGPGEGSPYSGTHAVRKCVFYRDEDCAAKGTYSNELSTAYQKVNHLQIVIGGERKPLTAEQRASIIAKAYEKEKVTYKEVRKIIGLEKNEDARFNALNYSTRKKKKKSEEEGENIFKCEGATFISLANSNKIRKVLPDELKNNVEVIDEIAEICTKYKSEKNLKEAISNSEELKCVLDEEVVDQLLDIDMTGYGHLSLKALREILPYLRQGEIYSVACEKAGHNHAQFTTEKTTYLGKNAEVRKIVDGINSPVVKRSVSQTIKVIDSIIRQYDSPYAINIELAREMSQSRKERDEATRNIQERTRENEQIKAELVEHGAMPTADNVLKYKLYKEQNSKCMYSGKEIDPVRFFTDGKYCEIDHIIPYSRSFDDSFNNKVLVLSSENQNKRNSTPYEFFERTGRDWDEFEARVKATYRNVNSKKLELLLKKKFDEKEWRDRALNDTRYASKLLYELIKDHLVFDERNKKGKTVLTVNGRITAYIRRFWGVSKIRSDGDKHHALDAAVIASVTDGMIQRITDYNYVKETYRRGNGEYMLPDGEIVSSEYYDKNSHFVLPYPYPLFCKELAARMMDDELGMKIELKKMGMADDDVNAAKPFIVSRMPHRKAKGAIHEASVWSSKYADEKANGEDGVLVRRKPLTELSLKDGEIKGYFNPEGDRALYEAIKQRLIAYGGDAKKAFVEPLYKPCKQGQGNVVRTVKVCEPYKGGGVRLDKVSGIAANGAMVRVDLYSKNNKYYGVPVYTADIYKGVLPRLASTAGKSRSEWRFMDETYTFEMSIYPNDLLKIESVKPIEMSMIRKDEKSQRPEKISFVSGLVYYVSFGISTASMTVEDTNGCYEKGSMGIQNLKKITKCEIDVLGNVVEIARRPNGPQLPKMKK